MHYNPFAYIHSEKDILKLVTTLISNTKGEQKGGDEFWTKAETLLYCALIGYIHYEAPAEEQNFSTLIEFINAMEVREDDEEFQNPVDLMFEELAQKNPNHFAVRQYAKYKLAAGKTAKSILVSAAVRLAPFNLPQLKVITGSGERPRTLCFGQRKASLIRAKNHTVAQLTIRTAVHNGTAFAHCFDGQNAYYSIGNDTSNGEVGLKFFNPKHVFPFR